MRWIVEWSLKFRLFTIALAIAMLFVGITQLRTMSVDALPEFAPPYVEVQTEAPGLSASEVEELVTLNLEELLNGTPWLQTIRSTSVTGLSSITLIFQPGTDILRARQLVSERLSLAYTLPNVAKPPVILQPMSATNRVLMVGLSSQQVSPILMSVLARWDIRPALLSVPGVANVAVWGMRDRQLQVQVDPQRLQQQHVTLDQIVSTTGNALWVSPLSFLNASAPGSGGWIESPQQRIEVRHVLPISTPQELAQVNVEGTKLSLGDVATVVEDHQPLNGDDLLNSQPGLLLVIEKFPGANTPEVTRGIEAKLAELQPGLAGMQIDTSLFRPASFVEMAINHLALALLLGWLLIGLVLFTFFEWRAALISLVTIPLALVAVGLVLALSGGTINLLVLAGVVVASGIIIDDAIITVENVRRHLRQRGLEEGDNHTTASIILEALQEVSRPMLYATLIILLALLPVFLLQGISGSFFHPLIVTAALAILASLVIALTVTPALCLLLLSRAPQTRPELPVRRWLQRSYNALVAKSVRALRPAFLASGIIVTSGLALVGVMLLPSLGTQMLPSFKEPDITVQWESAPGTSYQEMIRITTRVSNELRSIPGVRSVASHIGRAEQGDQVVDINSAELAINVDPANYDTTVAAIQKTVNGYPGMQHQVQTYLKGKTRQVITGSNNEIVVRIYGNQLDTLRAKADEVRQVLSHIDGAVDVHTEAQVDQPQIEVKVDLAKAQRYGLKPGDIRRAAATLVAGIAAGSLFEDQKVFDVTVLGTPSARQSLTSVRNLLIDVPGGGLVRLGDVADVSIKPTPNTIQHETVSRRIDVSLNTRGRDPGSVVNDIKDRLQDVTFPLEYRAEVLGEYQERQDAQIRLFGFGAIAALGIFLLLQAAFGSWGLALLVCASLPAALLGGVIAAFASGNILSLVALTGFFTILGIAVRNSLMLISRYRYLERQGGMQHGPELVLQGAQERFAPTLMTALATGLALMPLVISGNISGQEIAYPMAIVILGGLVTSTILTLFVVPSLYLRFGARRARGEGAEASQQEEQMEGDQRGTPWWLTLNPARFLPYAKLASAGGGSQMRHAHRWIVALLLIAVLSLAACEQTGSTGTPGEEEPARVEQIAGTDISRVILTEQAAKRVDIQTVPLREVQIRGAARKVVPYSAIIYDLHGQTWVYASPSHLTFAREQVSVDTIEGDQAILSQGPPVGTEIVTVGAPELYGTEFSGGLQP